MQIRKRETFGAYLAPRFHIRKAARVKTPAVSVSHNKCAGPHGSIAKGVTKMNVVGTCTYIATAWRASVVSNGHSPAMLR
jgi:hypothetical protein